MRMGSRSHLLATAMLLAGSSLSPANGWAQLSGGPTTSKPGAVENVPGGAGGAGVASPPSLDMPTRSAAPRPSDKAPAAAPPNAPEATSPPSDKGKVSKK